MTVKDVLKVITEKTRAIVKFTIAFPDLNHNRKDGEENEASKSPKVQHRFTGNGEFFNCKNLQKAFGNILTFLLC